MTLQELTERLDMLMQQGYSQEEVYLDTGPNYLFTVGEVGIDADGVGIIIWKE